MINIDGLMVKKTASIQTAGNIVKTTFRKVTVTLDMWSYTFLSLEEHDFRMCTGICRRNDDCLGFKYKENACYMVSGDEPIADDGSTTIITSHDSLF